jgi:hypothetical protein
MAKPIRTLAAAALAVVMAGAVAAQPAGGPPLSDTRLTVSTLVREDIFAGFMQNDLTRMARGEASIEQLLKDRPNDRAALLAWRAGAKVNRAVVAKEAGRMADYARLYISATADMDEALSLHSADNAVPAVIGGVGVNFGDRLAKADQAANWTRTYAAYQGIYAQQGTIADKLPPHLRGELMGGLVTSAQRSGHDAEVGPLLDKMLVVVKGTPYEATALTWKADPKSMATTNLACKNCHDAGRLAPVMQGLAPKVG